jgi:hypothetical protein
VQRVFQSREALEKWLEARRSKLVIRSLTHPILNESRAALNRAIAHGHAQREDERCVKTRERRSRFSSKQSCSASCSISRLNDYANYARKTTQDDSQQSRTMPVLQAKATLKELEEALRQALHRTRSKRLRMKLQAVSSTQSVVCK